MIMSDHTQSAATSEFTSRTIAAQQPNDRFSYLFRSMAKRGIEDYSQIKISFDRLAEKLKEVASTGKIYYYPNPGNLGDALIRAGTEQFFSDFGIATTTIGHDEQRTLVRDDDLKNVPRTKVTGFRDSTLIYGGGGGWCRFWSSGKNTVEELSPHFRRIIVLPSTYETPVRLDHAQLYARDKFESMQNAQDALFCHDMAFYLLFSNPYNVSKRKVARTAYCFRKDEESQTQEKWRLPLSNVDISWHGTHLDSPLPILEHVAEHEFVHTDRLHVAIACCLTGTRFFLYPGAYFKNRAIFLSSMDPYFELGKWREHLPLTTRISNSVQRKTKKIFRVFKGPGMQ